MIRVALLVLLLSNSAFAGGKLTVYSRVVMASTTCNVDSDCDEFSIIPNYVKSACVMTKKTQKRHCAVYYGFCASGPGFTGVWNSQTKVCDLNLVMPNNGLICYSDADCGMGGGVSEFGNVQVSEGARCLLVPEANYGICTGVVTGATCCAWGKDEFGNCFPPSKYCFSNIDCYADNKVCVKHMCQTPSYSQKLGDGNVCETDDDCNAGWGNICVTTQSISSTGALCQECAQIDGDTPGVHLGCTLERPRCKWGFGMPNPETGEYHSVYSCAVN